VSFIVAIVLVLFAASFLNRLMRPKIGNRYLRSLLGVISAGVAIWLFSTVLSSVLFTVAGENADPRAAGTVAGDLTGTGIAAVIPALILRLIWDFVRPPRKIEDENG
jgi:hypothetical protein